MAAQLGSSDRERIPIRIMPVTDAAGNYHTVGSGSDSSSRPHQVITPTTCHCCRHTTAHAELTTTSTIGCLTRSFLLVMI